MGKFNHFFGLPELQNFDPSFWVVSIHLFLLCISQYIYSETSHILYAHAYLIIHYQLYENVFTYVTESDKISLMTVFEIIQKSWYSWKVAS